MNDLTIEEIAIKYARIEDKIPSIWPTYQDAGKEMSQDLLYHWDIQNPELIRVICLTEGYCKGIKISQHIDVKLSHFGLYPSVQKYHDVTYENIPEHYKEAILNDLINKRYGKRKS